MKKLYLASKYYLSVSFMVSAGLLFRLNEVSTMLITFSSGLLLGWFFYNQEEFKEKIKGVRLIAIGFFMMVLSIYLIFLAGSWYEMDKALKNDTVEMGLMGFTMFFWAVLCILRFKNIELKIIGLDFLLTVSYIVFGTSLVLITNSI